MLLIFGLHAWTLSGIGNVPDVIVVAVDNDG